MINWQQPGLQFCRQLFDTADAFHELAFAEMLKKGANLTIRQCIMVKEMSMLAATNPEGVTLKEIAARLELTPGTVSELVETLVQRGILRRETDSTDRRKVKICLSDEYYHKLEEGLDRMSTLAMKALNSIAGKEREILMTILCKVQNKLNNIKEKGL